MEPGSRTSSLPAVLLAGLLSLSLLVAGCGGDDEPADQTSADAPPAQTQASALSEPKLADQGAGQGKSLTVGDGEGGVKLTEIGSFESPLYVTQPRSSESGEQTGTDALYVVEQGGTIRVIRDGETLEEPFLDISDLVVAGGEQGLLSIAFPPDYASSGLFYVDYTDTEGDTQVVEYQRSAEDPYLADSGSAREVLFQDQPYANHNGGLLLFDSEGNLLIGFGDGGSAGDPERNAQSLGTFLGKLLRIDPKAGGDEPYSVPADNPFISREGALPEIYSYGLRNPWRFSFDRMTGALTIGDVGQSTYEEIDIVGAGRGGGANFGWSAFEGTERYNDDQEAAGHIEPVLQYGRDDGCSVTGGYVVRDRDLRSLYGRYLYGDFCAGALRSFKPSDDRAQDDKEIGLEVSSLSSFGEDAAGNIYAISLEGPVYRLDPS